MPIMGTKITYFDEFLADWDKYIVKIVSKHPGKHFEALPMSISIRDRVENTKIHIFSGKMINFPCFQQDLNNIFMKLSRKKEVVGDTKSVKKSKKLRKHLI